jgi:hypothetical protein
MLSYNWEPMRNVLFYIVLFVVFSAVSTQATAQSRSGIDFDNSEPELDKYYMRGSYLVYDCKTKHWVCTRKLEHKRCKSIRKESLLDLDLRLPCAYFNQYKTQELCIEEQIRLTDQGRGDRFCLHPNQKGLKRDF